MKFSDLGTDNLKDSSTFKKIQYFSKSNPQKLYSNIDKFNLKYKKISDLYLNDNDVLNSSNYGLKRQHVFTSQKSSLNNSATLLDAKGFNSLMSYNQSILNSNSSNILSNNTKFYQHLPSLEVTSASTTLNTKLNKGLENKSSFSLTSHAAFPEKPALLSAENDSTQISNPLKYALNTK
jgi:hypothetical protein